MVNIFVSLHMTMITHRYLAVQVIGPTFWIEQCLHLGWFGCEWVRVKKKLCTILILTAILKCKQLKVMKHGLQPIT